MMVILRSFVIVFVWITIAQPGEGTASEQAVFRRNKQQYLLNHVIKTTWADSELECGIHCVADKSCGSVNYKNSGIGKGRCELNNKTVEKTSNVNDKTRHPEFNHLAVSKRVSYTVVHEFGA